jgi:S1-C subfamily serine protease
MRKRFAFGIVIVFAVAIIMITIPFNRFILPSTAVGQQQQQQQQPLSSFKPLVLGNSSNIDVGDAVIAIGNPFDLSDTMTTGIVSGIGRSLPAAASGGFFIPNTIQTDAPINPGNSGGPLLDMQAKMVGMNTAILSGTNTFSGIGFAIPSNTITKIVPTLIEKGIIHIRILDLGMEH